MSFLSGSPWQQPGIISGNSGYGQPSSGHQQPQQQHQQHKPPNILPGANIPVVLAPSPLSPSSPASAWHSDWHCQGQMALGVNVAAATKGGSRITLTEDVEVKLGRGRTEGTSSGSAAEAPETPGLKMPVFKIEDEGSAGGRLREERHRAEGAAGSLGSAGQSPSSPLSSSSSSSLPSPLVSAGKSFLNTALDTKTTSKSNFGPNNSQQNLNGSVSIQGSAVGAQGQDTLLPKQASRFEDVNTLNPSFTGSARSSPEKKEDERVKVCPSTSEGLLRKTSPDAQTPGPALIAANLTGSKSAVGAGGGEKSGVERGDSKHTEKGRPEIRDVIQGPSQDSISVEDGKVGSSAPRNTETKTSNISQMPQRSVVRRAMSDCSHLSVPTMQAETYPNTMVGSPAGTTNLPNFARMGAACPARVPYPHMAVRRSLTVTDGTQATPAFATMLSSPLMFSPVLPSSPPPRRHHGSCESNLLLCVPAPAGTSINRTQDSKLNTMGKSLFFCVGVEIYCREQS